MSTIPDVPPDDGRPLLLVWGNCQAESLRLLLDAGDVRSVRLPAVHEIRASEVVALHRMVGVADLLVSQPVGDDYHDLPVGTAQLLERLPDSARHVVVPIVRYAGLHPHHVVVHPPGLIDPLPPLVPYHDLRTAVAAAWAATDRRAPAEALTHLTHDAVRAVAHLSTDRLRRREASLDVTVADLLDDPTFDAMRTINHPGNAVLAPLASRIRAGLGLPDRPPGTTRRLLDSVRAPRDPVVAAVWDRVATPEDRWFVDGRVLAGAEVADAHGRFYRERPDVLSEVLRRSAPERSILGLRTPEECA